MTAGAPGATVPHACGDYDAVYAEAYPDFRRERRSPGRSSLRMLRVEQTSHETADPAIDEVVMRLVTGKPIAHSSVNFGEGRVALSGAAGSFYLAPPDAVADWRAEGEHTVMLLAAHPAKLGEWLGDGALDPLYGRELHDTRLARLMADIWKEASAEDAVSATVADGLLMTLAGSLARRAGALPATDDARETALDQRRLGRVIAFIDAHLERSIGVSDLASVACMSPAHFSRRFRLATNASPHSFVLSRRIERAQDMIRSDEPLAEVAFACGFSSQSHFTERFRAATGITPGAYRRACGD